MNDKPRKHFGAFCDEGSKVLILGSFPSKSSLEAGFFYQNCTNRFWCVLSRVFGEKGLVGDIEAQKTFLKKHHIALYDIWDECYYAKANSNADKDIDADKSVMARLDGVLKKAQIKAVFTTIGKGKNKDDCFCKWGVKEWIQGYFPHQNIDEVLYALYSTSSRSPKTDDELFEDYKIIAEILGKDKK